MPLQIWTLKLTDYKWRQHRPHISYLAMGQFKRKRNWKQSQHHVASSAVCCQTSVAQKPSDTLAERFTPGCTFTEPTSHQASDISLHGNIALPVSQPILSFFIASHSKCTSSCRGALVARQRQTLNGSELTCGRAARMIRAAGGHRQPIGQPVCCRRKICLRYSWTRGRSPIALTRAQLTGATPLDP